LIDSDPGGPLTDDQPPKQPADDADGHPSSKPAWQRGEDLAARHLEELGYTIIARNWRSPHTRHEIDLIARDGKTIVFVEVKTARTEQFGDPLSWITPHKQEAIITAARAFVAGWHDKETDFRFDVVTVGPPDPNGDWPVNHLSNAFQM
jgi:putative endonuclease